MSVSKTGVQGSGVVKLPPGFYGNTGAAYSDASCTVNSCSVTFKLLTVRYFSVGFSRTTAKYERAKTLAKPYTGFIQKITAIFYGRFKDNLLGI